MDPNMSGMPMAGAGTTLIDRVLLIWFVLTALSVLHGGVDAPIVSGLRSLPQCRKNYRATSAPL